MKNESILSVKDLSVSFHMYEKGLEQYDLKVISNMTLDVRPGEIVAIAGSSGSACTSGSLDPSHVLLAIGLPHEIAHGSLRLTLGEDNTMEEMDYVVDKVKGVVERLRAMSPLYEDFVKKNK